MMFFYKKNKLNTILINIDHIVNIDYNPYCDELKITLVTGEILTIQENYEEIYSNLLNALVKQKGVTE